jgi:putative SOS response-associated peptidase YedK
MCGRVRLPDDYSEIQLSLFKDGWRGTTSRRWNVPPTSMLPVVTSTSGQRTLEPMRWGLIPSWSKDEKIGFSTFNARADSVDTKPAFRGAWKAGRRCLIITDGFYEWRRAGTADKQPFAISLGNRGPMLMVLWEARQTPAGEWTRSCTIITTDANDLIAEIHDRMPVILNGDDWGAWLKAR